MRMLMSSEKPKLYLAAPLFSQSELSFNQDLADRLSKYFDVFLPQRDGGLMNEMIDRGVPVALASQYVFNIDIQAIKSVDVILAVLDGRSIDEGVAVELGYAYALNKLCVGLQTSPIRLLPSGNNPMISNVLESTFSSVNSVINWAISFSASARTDSGRIDCWEAAKIPTN